MKKLTVLTMVAMAALLFTSCSKNDYKSFVGIWGVEKIEYYNTDYAGNPIASSLETFTYDAEDADNGIRLIFRANKTGEMRDSAIDSILKVQDGDTIYVQCSDTVVVTKFTYSYDKNEKSLYMNMSSSARPFRLQIIESSDDSFIYENEYGDNYMEKAYLKRLSKSTNSSSRNVPSHPHNRPGSLFGSR
jgi:hypothetical protein